MTTTAPRASSRRPPSLSTASSPSHSSSSSISRGATARSAAGPRTPSSLNSAASRRPLSRSSTNSVVNGEALAEISTELKEATEKKEQLMLKLQDKDQTIDNLGKENDRLALALNDAERSLNDLYAEQSRSEQELAQRIDISEKLRFQVRELEKEKRELLRRYNEQTATFDAERQSFYDNEQHLKSRIQSLFQARKKPESPVFVEPESEAEYEEEENKAEHGPEPKSVTQDLSDPAQEPAEMTALKLELSTLSTSHSSLQSTLMLLQGQLGDLNRVNKQLQEENESYMILLQERTLSGRFDLLKQVGGGADDDDDDEESDMGDVGSLRSTGRSTLDRVDEELAENAGSLADEFSRNFDLSQEDSASRQGRPRQGRNQSSSSSHSPAPQGESLADLPITGPGLDLAAELGRAENKDILEGDADAPSTPSKNKRSRKDSKAGFIEPGVSTSDLLALRSEVKALKDANKALSLYASKIIDRIIAQEGFEHVLAVDYENEPVTPSTAAPKTAKPRPQSAIVNRTYSAPGSEFPHPNGTGFNVPKLGTPPIPASPSTKANRRSLSFDWKGLFGGEKKPEPNLRPLTLKPGASPVTGARKLDTTEDENDRRERERINATMKLMGIEPSPSLASPAPMQKSFSSPGPAPPPSSNSNRRFSMFGSRTPASEPASSPVSTPPLSTSNSTGIGLGIEGGLTQEVLEQVEAQNSLAALDAHERTLSSEIAKGGGSGFTEIRRNSRRGRRSAGGRSAGGSDSGSTVWSAGIGEDEE